MTRREFVTLRNYDEGWSLTARGATTDDARLAALRLLVFGHAWERERDQ